MGPGGDHLEPQREGVPGCSSRDAPKLRHGEGRRIQQEIEDLPMRQK